jgi:sugar lactone lactonase YvrE
MLLDEAYGPEPLPDGSLIVVKLTDQGDNQLFHFWPDTGKLDALPAFLMKGDMTPMLRAFPDGKELVYFGFSEKERSQSARMWVLDLASRRTRELAPGLPVDPVSDGWSPLGVARDGESVYLATKDGDTQPLVQVPRKPGSRPRTLLSFPTTAAPVAMDAARDGSLYLDLLQTATVILRVPATGGAGEEFAMPTLDNFPMIAPGGEVLATLKGWGKQYLAAVRPGGQPRALVDTPEDTALPATIFGGNVAFVIGSGDRRRIAIAALRDGHVLRRFSARSDNGMAASPDGNTLYYTFSAGIWAQPVAGGEPKRITEGIDVTLDPKGEYLYVKRARKGVMGIFRIPVAGGDAEELPVPAEYHVAYPGLSPAAVDARGRILVPVVSKDWWYYQTAILDPAAKSFTLVPMAIDGDASPAGWAPDGRILARGKRYFFSLWRYRRSKGLR